MIKVTVWYTDGEVVEASPSDWPTLRSDGVDYIQIDNAQGAVQFNGKSLYWCRDNGDGSFTFGGASYYVDHEGGETTFDDTTQTHHSLPDGVPDMTIDQVKLGWWKPNLPKP